MSVPQTVRFEMIVRYDRIERPADQPVASETLTFETMEKMDERYRKERKRRKLADRATSGKWRTVLTDHGREVIAAGDVYCRAAHANVGTWHDYKW